MLTGFALDAIFGDPYSFPHIIRWMGNLIAGLEKYLRGVLPKTKHGEKNGGVLLVCTVVVIFTGIPFVILFLCYRYIPLVGFAVESFLCWQLLAAKSLKVESMKVYRSLKAGDMEKARYNVSMIVGRDTAVLDKDGITRATIETVAENTSDGVVAPLIFIMLGGGVLGCLYKAVNTMDSMVGYKNDKYLHFGRFTAKTDDVLNYIPSRLCAVLMIIAAYVLRLDGKNSFTIWRRDRRKHTSPNSAQTEAVCAGALRVKLAGPISYFGKTRDKPYIGDDTRPVSIEDIKIANRLMYTTSVFMLIFAALFRAAVLGVICLG